jgi:hypothetical protein
MYSSSDRESDMLAVGTKVRDTYQYSETGVISKPRRGEAKLSGWYIVEYDYEVRDYRTGKKRKARSLVHGDMLAVRND